jgi:hypothetical protein
VSANLILVMFGFSKEWEAELQQFKSNSVKKAKMDKPICLK